jgi:translation initiation factor 4A
MNKEANEESSNNPQNNSEYEIKTWEDIDLQPNILRGIFSCGYENPSPIQQKAILPIIKKRDILAQAQSGTGKTAAFTIGALSLIDLSINQTQILILSPTRELTMQTSNVVKNIGIMMDELRVQTLYGGLYIEEGNGFLSRKTPHVICGCPGRVNDMMRRDRIDTRDIKLIILDEADEMLSSGFKDQIYNIFQRLPEDVQVALFSATMPGHLMAIVNKIMRNPVNISVKSEMLTLEGISQYYVAVEDDRQKYATLKHIFSFLTVSQCIIYCNSVKRVSDLHEAMLEDNFPVSCIHSDMDKASRDKAFNDFRCGSSRVLISSNVTARGIDIQQVSVVINFDLPKCVHTYLHRIGRSGRWGRKGVGINFITRRDVVKMREIETHYVCEIRELPNNLDFLHKF